MQSLAISVQRAMPRIYFFANVGLFRAGSWRIFAALFLVTFTAACSAGANKVDPRASVDYPPGAWQGVWEGNATTADGTRTLIEFRIFEDRNQISGSYICDSGNSPCRNRNRGGTIVRAVTRDSSFRASIVLNADQSICRFWGGARGNVLKGIYVCYQNGIIVELGRWRVERKF